MDGLYKYLKHLNVPNEDLQNIKEYFEVKAYDTDSVTHDVTNCNTFEDVELSFIYNMNPEHGRKIQQYAHHVARMLSVLCFLCMNY